jgi:hypothetical protein
MPWDLVNHSISERCERAYDTVMILGYRQRGGRANGGGTCHDLCLLGLGHLTVCLLGIGRRKECRCEDFR